MYTITNVLCSCYNKTISMVMNNNGCVDKIHFVRNKRSKKNYLFQKYKGHLKTYRIRNLNVFIGYCLINNLHFKIVIESKKSAK